MYTVVVLIPKRFTKSCTMVSRSRHGVHRHAQRGHVPHAGPGAQTPPGARHSQAGAGALGDQFGQHREDARDQAAVGSRGVDLGAGSGEGVGLHVEGLSAVRLGDTGVAEVWRFPSHSQWTGASCNAAKKYSTGFLVRMGGFSDIDGRNWNIGRLSVPFRLA